MSNEKQTNIYNALVWLYESTFNDSGDLSTGVREDQTFIVKKGGKLRVKHLTEASRNAMATKQNRSIDQIPVAVLEYASPEALDAFKASKGAATTSAASGKAAVARF